MPGTSVTLGEHFEGFISQQISTGRYKSASEVMRDALRLLEERDEYRSAVIHALIEGENSGTSSRSPAEIKRSVEEQARRDGII